MTKRIRFIWMFALLALFAHINKIEFIVFCFYRTLEEQKAVFEDNKSKCDGVINKSKHQLWRAIDLAIVKKGKCVWDRTAEYQLLGRFWKLMGGKFGGDFGFAEDIFHFEY